MSEWIVERAGTRGGDSARGTAGDSARGTAGATAADALLLEERLPPAVESRPAFRHAGAEGRRP